MDGSLRDRSSDDIVPIDSQLQLTMDSDYSFINSTPTKMTASTPKTDKPSELIGKSCTRPQRERRLPKYLKDYQI